VIAAALLPVPAGTIRLRRPGEMIRIWNQQLTLSSEKSKWLVLREGAFFNELGQ
jgi:hypothetical protein